MAPQSAIIEIAESAHVMGEGGGRKGGRGEAAFVEETFEEC